MPTGFQGAWSAPGAPGRKDVLNGALVFRAGPLKLAPGDYVITYWSVDGVGNVEKAHTILIKVSDDRGDDRGDDRRDE